jgi:hypothetical protein
MSREITRAIVEDRLKELRKLSYGELTKLVGQVSRDRMKRPDGEYQVETEARWDGKTGGDIRVIVAADAPGTGTFKTVTADFIMSGDGSFIGEK